MAEDALRPDTGQPDDGCAALRCLPGGLKTDTAHAGIHREVEIGDLALPDSLLRKSHRVLIMEDSGTHILTHRMLQGRDGHPSQDQDGGSQTCLAQLQSLQHRGNTEESALILQQTGHLNGAVAVGIRLHHCHHRHAGLFLHRPEIGGNGIQIDLYISAVKIQSGVLPLLLYTSVYHIFVNL